MNEANREGGLPSFLTRRLSSLDLAAAPRKKACRCQLRVTSARKRILPRILSPIPPPWEPIFNSMRPMINGEGDGSETGPEEVTTTSLSIRFLHQSDESDYQIYKIIYDKNFHDPRCYNKTAVSSQNSELRARELLPTRQWEPFYLRHQKSQDHPKIRLNPPSRELIDFYY